MICDILNINLVTTSVATAKSNVERQNKTFKDRLIAEFRHEGINNIDEANKYLNEIFIPKMNKKFSYEIDYESSRMKSNNYSEEELKKLYKEQKESGTIRKGKKVGRNDPCPCGSGKKYKNCCMNKDMEE